MESIGTIGKAPSVEHCKSKIEKKKVDDERDLEMSAAEMVVEINDMEEQCEIVKVKLVHSRWVGQQLEEQLKEQKKEMKDLEDLRDVDVEDSTSELLPLRESIKQIASKNKELSKANDELEEEIADEKQRYDDVRSLVVTLTNERCDWLEKKRSCERIAEGDDSEINKKKSKFMEHLEGIMLEEKKDDLKDIRENLDTLLEVQKSNFGRQVVRLLLGEETHQRVRKLERKCAALERAAKKRRRMEALKSQEE